MRTPLALAGQARVIASSDAFVVPQAAPPAMLLKDDAAAAALEQPGSQRPDEKSGARTLLGTILSYPLSPTSAVGLNTITVKAIPDGVVSNHLVRRARAGTNVQLDQACGDFTLAIRLRPRLCSSPPEVGSRR